MKFLFCQECGDLVRPRKASAGAPRSCFCGRYAAWFKEDGIVMAVFDHHNRRADGNRAIVVAISNELFEDPEHAQSGEQIAALLARHAEGDRFKAAGSLVLCAPPGVSPRTEWADALPQTPASGQSPAFTLKF